MSRIEKENSHKAMGLSPEYQIPPDVVPMNNADLSRQGALLSRNGQPLHFVRGPFWRTKSGDPTVRKSDVKELHYSWESPKYPQLSCGGELELFCFESKSADLYPIMGTDSPIVEVLEEHNNNTVNDNGMHELEDPFSEEPETVNFSPELMAGQIELNFAHNPDPTQRASKMLSVLKKLTRVTAEHGALIVPIASLPHRQLKEEDVSPNPYVRRIALDHMGWQRVQHFIGSSFQTHVEMSDSQAGLRSINYLQQISPLFLAISTAGPFVNGKSDIDHSDVPGLSGDTSRVHSVRYLGRKFGSPSGGVIEFPAPSSLYRMHEIQNQRLMSQDIPTPARGLGHHTSFRFRQDIGPRGTIEYADPDTFGADPVRLAAFQELNKAVTVLVQHHTYDHSESRLPPELFSKLNQEVLEIVEQNMISVSTDGLHANIISPEGQLRSVKSQIEKLLLWTKDPKTSIQFPGLSKRVTDTIRRSTLIPEEHAFAGLLPNNEAFIEGFYSTGYGTLSQWLHARNDYLMSRGLNERQSVTRTIMELGYAFHDHIYRLTEDSMNTLFA